MADKKKSGTPQTGYGEYVVFDGVRIQLAQHLTDFQTMGAPVPSAETIAARPELANVKRLNATMMRMRADSAVARDVLMDEVREGSAIAAHVYVRADTGEEITFGKRVIVKLRQNDAALLHQIAETFALAPVGKQGDEDVLELSPAATENPLKIANRIAEIDGVEYAQPERLLNLQMHATGVLSSRQWYLSPALLSHPDVLPTAGIECPEAWMITRGTPSIVVAVIDDGFQLAHKAFAGKAIHPAARDYAQADQDPNPQSQDYHGTPVASIATGSDQGGAMSGVAPGCSFLPIRIGFGSTAAAFDMLDVFKHASQHADVVNCSFGFGPSSMPILTQGQVQAITALTQTGGRRGKGLVLVFSAANDDVPTYLPAAQNVGGLRFTRPAPFGGMQGAHIPAGKPVYSGYPMVPGVIVVGASSSRKRKSGYSNWGQHITVVAPSNNMHYNMAFLPPNDPFRTPFVANYRGLGQVAASNRPPAGTFSPLLDDTGTAGVREDDYTADFGGTSGAAPVVTGVVALMLSANPNLTATQVREILMATTDQDMDATLDLAADPNIVPNTGGAPLGFQNGRSLLFGSGKVNARKAVQKAKALAPPPVPAVGIPASEPLRLLSSWYGVVHGKDDQGNLIVTGLSTSISQVCGGVHAQLIPDVPRSPAGHCGSKQIWQLYLPN
jgi:subtilisin family serine protease